MADSKFSLARYYKDLSRLFKSGPIQKQKIANKIAAPGSNPGQPVGTARSFLSDTNAMYNSLVGNYSAYSRMARFSDFEEMEQMPEISAALDLYAEEACAKDEKGKIFKIKSSNSVIQKTLNQLFGNILNLEFDAATWIRSFPVSSDSPIPLLNGEIVEIKELSKRVKAGEDIYVYSVTDKENSVVAGKVVWCDKNYTSNVLIKVMLDDNTFIKTAPEHPFLLRDGTRKRADELKPNDSLMPFYRKLSQKGEPVVGYEKIYDPKTDSYKLTHRIVANEIYKNSWKDGKKKVIHHKDFVKLNNDPSNLEVMNVDEHLEIHREITNKILKSKEVTEKRLQALQVYLRSDERKKKMSNKMKGIYSPYFKEYNESGANLEHNTIRSKSAKKLWENEDFRNKINAGKVLFFDEFCKNKILSINLNSFVAAKNARSILSNDKEFVEHLKSINPNFKLNIKTYLNNRSSFTNALLRSYNEDYYSLIKQNKNIINDEKYIKCSQVSKKLKNHKVISIEVLNEVDDVYCMTVVSKDNVRDRHNFAICGRNADGSIAKDSGIFVENCKYGDCFLLVDHHPDYGVLGLYPLPVNEIEREEGFDKENPLAFRFRWTTKGNKVLENWQILHLRMPGNDRYHPYGSSVIDAARRPYRQITLLEDAVMVYRIVRAPERRAFYIGVGNTDPKDIPAFMEKVKNQLKTNSIVGSDGKIDYRFNALNVLEDYFLPTRGEGDGTRIDPLPGGQFVGDIEDLTYIQNKLFAALKIPKSYLGYEEGVGKATLTQEDVRFARTIQKIQRVLIAELNKVAIIHLYSMGFSDDELFNFEITMANPSTVGELQKLELWRTRLEVASMAQENTFDKNYIWKELFNLNDEEIESIKEGLKKDRLLNAELDAVTAGSMPASPEVDGADSVDASGAGSSPPEAGLPPPPGEETDNVEKNSLETASRDPMKQVAAPNELMKPFVKKNEKSLNPNLFNYATNTKKTGMDPKRQYSELMRGIRAPFGETKETPNEENYEDILEKINNKNLVSNKKFVQSLEKSETFKVAKSKKVLSD